MGLNYDSERILVSKQEFDEVLSKHVNEKLKELEKSKAHKLEVIDLALRCPDVTSGNLFKTVNEIMDFLKSE